jgi:hypothetical protein
MTALNATRKPTMWQVPPRREYNPKAMDAGQRVTWHVRIDGHYANPPRFEGGEYRGGTGWVDAVTYTREGTVWSVATSASAWWVVPDDEPGNPVVVRRAGKSYRHGWPEGALYQSREHEHWRDAMRRAENVRRLGVFAVIERTDPGRYDYASRRHGSDTHTLCWHADQDCPDAASKQRWDGQGYAHNSHGPDGARWSAHSIASVLIGVTEYGGNLPVCSRCVLAEVPAGELAAA